MTTTTTDIDALRDRVQRLGFFGLLASWNDIALEPYRLKEAKERAANKSASRAKKRA
jgi:hypothetical protein